MKTQLHVFLKQFIRACFSFLFIFFLINLIQTVITDLPVKQQTSLWSRMTDFSNNHISHTSSVSYSRYTVYYIC